VGKKRLLWEEVFGFSGAWRGLTRLGGGEEENEGTRQSTKKVGEGSLAEKGH